jgi:peptidoglycan hydrolase-like protein with peptidoglycan-binding domain
MAITAGAVVIVVVLVALIRPFGFNLAHPFGDGAAAGAAGKDTAASTATVARRSLTAQMSLGGTLGYAGDYTVVGQAQGIVTALPAAGQVIHQGEPLYAVNGSPVVLLHGSVPAYRDLTSGVSGKDVRQLNAALVDLGYLDQASDEFTAATAGAVKKMQAHLGLAQTGKLTLGQIVFLPTDARIADVRATLGDHLSGPILTATSTTREITVSLDAGRQSQVKVGDQVVITLPDGKTTKGTVSAVSAVATTGSDSGSAPDTPKVTVVITPTDSAATGMLDQAPVQVAITTDTVKNALVVPVTALLALAGGGYAVEVVVADGTHHLASVSLGLFDDSQGMVQITGDGLSAGQRVVVPAT